MPSGGAHLEATAGLSANVRLAAINKKLRLAARDSNSQNSSEQHETWSFAGRHHLRTNQAASELSESPSLSSGSSSNGSSTLQRTDRCSWEETRDAMAAERKATQAQAPSPFAGSRESFTDDSSETGSPSTSSLSRSSGMVLTLDDRNASISGDMDAKERLPADWAPWQLDPDAISPVKGNDGKPVSLGKGAYGEVFLAMMNGVTPVAVKAMKLHETNGDLLNSLREVALLRALQNSHIVQFQGACIRDERLMLVTEYMDGGNLFKAIQNDLISWHCRGSQVALEVARGLHFLHCNRVLHLDLKTANILLTRHGLAKIADVGMARIMGNSGDQTDMDAVSTMGTFAYSAPELLRVGAVPTKKADMFSFGVVLHEISTGKAPVRGRMTPVRVPQDCPQEIKALIDSCMSFDPDDRPTALEAFEAIRRSQRQVKASQRSESADRGSTLQWSRRIRKQTAAFTSNVAAMANMAALSLSPGAATGLPPKPGSATNSGASFTQRTQLDQDIGSVRRLTL